MVEHPVGRPQTGPINWVDSSAFSAAAFSETAGASNVRRFLLALRIMSPMAPTQANGTAFAV
jgi:hypothetical protein